MREILRTPTQRYSQEYGSTLVYHHMYTKFLYYRIAGKFGGELNLALWRIDQLTAKLKIRQYLIRVYTYVRKINNGCGRSIGQAHERELIVDLSCFLTCMLGGVRFYYYLPCRCIDSSPKLACYRDCHR